WRGHGIETAQGQKGEHPNTFDPLFSGRLVAPHLTEPNDERRDHHNSDPIRQEPRAPNLPKWSGGMKQGHGEGAAKCGSCGCDTGSGYKAQDATQITKCEWSSKPQLKQPGRQDGLTSIAKALEG